MNYNSLALTNSSAPIKLPGYGNSRDPEHTIPQDKFSTGSAVLQALASLLPSSSQPHPLVIIAHDRGARIAHRIAVSRSSFSAFQLKAVSLMDIVPTTVQFAAFGKAKEACTYWHWPFLANVEIATKLILAFGGENWIRMTFGRTAGKSAQGLQKLEEDNAAKVYGAHMDREDVVRASCEDYAAAAGVDLERQAEDQEAGRKIDVPVLLIFSAAQLGARFDVEGIWRKDWVKEGVEVEALPVGDGIGHYVPEEAPDVVGERLLGWLMGF